MKIEEIRVQVSVSYTGLSYDQDNALLDAVQDVGEFVAKEQQLIGCGCLPDGFIIFVGTDMPTKEEKEEMKMSLRNAIKEVKKKHRGN